jgi:hypothetical protein
MSRQRPYTGRRSPRWHLRSVLSDQAHGADDCEGRPDHDVGTSREMYGGDLDLETGGRDGIVCHVAFPIRHLPG